jgi:hypothetical protein
VALVMALAACASASWAQDSGACVTAKVPESFTLPDGTVHAAGRLTLCAVQAFTPVVGLHRVWVDGEGANFVMSRVARAEAKGDSPPVLLFRRVAGSPLELVGYVLPSERQSWSYALQRANRTDSATQEAFGAVRGLDDLVVPLSSSAH